MKIEGVRIPGGVALMMDTPGVWNLDWDLAGPGHSCQECITIKSREEAVQLLSAWVQKNPGYVFRVYATYSGVRAYCVSHRVHPHSPVVAESLEDLKMDPLFIRFMLKRGKWRTRISPKPSRKDLEKQVYTYMTTVGEGKCLPDLVKVVNQVLEQSRLACL